MTLCPCLPGVRLGVASETLTGSNMGFRSVRTNCSGCSGGRAVRSKGGVVVVVVVEKEKVVVVGAGPAERGVSVMEGM